MKLKTLSGYRRALIKEEEVGRAGRTSTVRPPVSSSRRKGAFCFPSCVPAGTSSGLTEEAKNWYKPYSWLRYDERGPKKSLLLPQCTEASKMKHE